MLVTDDGFGLKVETCSAFCVLKLLSKAVIVVLVVTLVPYIFISIYWTSLYQSLSFSVGNSSDYVWKYDSRE